MCNVVITVDNAGDNAGDRVGTVVDSPELHVAISAVVSTPGKVVPGESGSISLSTTLVTGATIVAAGTPVALLWVSDCLGTSVTNCGPPTLVTPLVTSAAVVAPARALVSRDGTILTGGTVIEASEVGLLSDLCRPASGLAPTGTASVVAT